VSIPLDEYAATAAKFNPVNFHADAIVALAKSAGMKFIVERVGEGGKGWKATTPWKVAPATAVSSWSANNVARNCCLCFQR